jgi:type IV pilus assembly protein PilO
VNLQLTRKHILIIFLSILVVGAITLSANFLYIVPVKNSVEQKMTELKLSKQELTIIENKLKQTNDQTILSTMELQKQVPVKRLLDQLLLNIEKAEIISGTNIIEIKINGTEQDEEIDLTVETSDSSSRNQNGDEETKAQEDVTLPNGIKKTSIILIGEAESYFDLEKFLYELQEMQRTVKIDQFSFTGIEEVYSVDQSTQLIDFEVAISAYYYPTLIDLQNELPPLDTPKDSNKKNPISEFPDLTESETP